MNGWLLDTNVISELRRPRPKTRVVAFVAAQPLEQLFVSAVTFAEIRYGIEMLSDPVRRADVNDWLNHQVRPMFDQRVLAVSEDVVFKWRLLVEEGRKAGRTFSQPDIELFSVSSISTVGFAVICTARRLRDHASARGGATSAR